MKPQQRGLRRCEHVSDEADVGGDGALELLMINQFRSGHESDTNASLCGARPAMNVKVPAGDTRWFKAGQFRRVHQELPNAARARKSNSACHQVSRIIYGDLPGWPKNSVLFQYLEMFQVAHIHYRKNWVNGLFFRFGTASPPPTPPWPLLPPHGGLRLRHVSPLRPYVILPRCAAAPQKRAWSLPPSALNLRLPLVLAPPVPASFRQSHVCFPPPRANVPPPCGSLPHCGHYFRLCSDLKLMIFYGSFRPPV